MSNIKERDILKLLRGEASAKKLKALEKWSSESTDNARDLDLYQSIFDESDHLSTYTKVDTDEAWSKFSSMLQTSVTDVDLLQYFDGVAPPAKRKSIDAWRNFSSKNKEDFDVFNLVVTESAHLNNFKKVDANEEWKSFSKAIKNKGQTPNLTVVGTAPVTQVLPPAVTTKTVSTSPTFIPPPTISETPVVPLSTTATDASPYITTQSRSSFRWQPLAIAASILLLSIFGWSLWKNAANTSIDSQELFLTYETKNTPETITISDGSIISLDEQTTVTYFKDIALTDDRSVILDGGGEFDVTSNPQKPFIVKAKRSGVGIRVLGTKFRLEKSDEFLEIIENIEGSVRAYSLEDTTTYVIMTAGDRYGFDGINFVNLNDRVEEYQGEQYDILYVLDYLMKESDWRVISRPMTDFDEKSIVTIDLSKPYEEILEDLSERADFEYIKLDCDGCYKITRFGGE